jgi:glutathione S-transferase
VIAECENRQILPKEELVLKVLGRVTSINVRKVLWTADELGFAYEREDRGLPIRNPRVPEFLALNPNGLVPVLIDDGFVLWESNPIMRYLAEGHEGDTRLIPGERHERALVEQWLDWQQTELVPAWAYAYRALGRKMPGYDDEAQIEKSIEHWTARMAILEKQLAGSQYVAGGFGLADIALGLAVHRWFSTSFEKPALPNVEGYYERLKARPAAAAHLTEKTP